MPRGKDISFTFFLLEFLPTNSGNIVLNKHLQKFNFNTVLYVIMHFIAVIRTFWCLIQSNYQSIISKYIATTALSESKNPDHDGIKMNLNGSKINQVFKTHLIFQNLKEFVLFDRNLTHNGSVTRWFPRAIYSRFTYWTIYDEKRD